MKKVMTERQRLIAYFLGLIQLDRSAHCVTKQRADEIRDQIRVMDLEQLMWVRDMWQGWKRDSVMGNRGTL